MLPPAWPLLWQHDEQAWHTASFSASQYTSVCPAQMDMHRFLWSFCEINGHYLQVVKTGRSVLGLAFFFNEIEEYADYTLVTLCEVAVALLPKMMVPKDKCNTYRKCVHIYIYV